MDNEHALFGYENAFATSSASCLICGLNVIGRPYVLDLKSEAKTTGCLLHRFHLYRSNWVGKKRQYEYPRDSGHKFSK